MDKRNILGIDVRAKRKRDVEMGIDNLEKYFSNPIIHREIKGDKVYVPLNLSRIWSNYED